MCVGSINSFCFSVLVGFLNLVPLQDFPIRLIQLRSSQVGISKHISSPCHWSLAEPISAFTLTPPREVSSCPFSPASHTFIYTHRIHQQIRPVLTKFHRFNVEITIRHFLSTGLKEGILNHWQFDWIKVILLVQKFITTLPICFILWSANFAFKKIWSVILKGSIYKTI